ncbi:MAG: carboxypeptidase-like regulatory domain-containing protein [Paludibaculum sp.]
MRTARLAALILGSLGLWAQGPGGEPQCTVEGTVVDARTQAGIPGAQVGAMMVQDGAAAARSTGLGGFTDNNGKFRLTKLKPGSYRIFAEKADFTPVRRGPLLLPVLEEGRELKGIRVELQPLATVSGRVVDEYGEPVSGATVQLTPRAGTSRRPSIVPIGGTASTDDRGVFLIHRALPGQYLLAASHMESRSVIYPIRGGGVTGYVTTYLPGVSDPAQAQPVAVTPGSEQTGLEIQLRREPVYRVRGVVLDESGARVPRFMVNVRTDTGLVPLPSRPFLNGQFELEGLRPGQYSLLARAMAVGDNGPSARLAFTVGPGDIDNLQVRLGAGVRLQGSAVLEGAGETKADWSRVVIASMFLDPLGAGDAPRAKPEADGSFVLELAATGSLWFKVIGRPAPGAYLAEIRSGPENLLGRSMDLSAGVPGPLRFVFRTGSARLSGQVEDVSGRAAGAGASVMAFEADPTRRNFSAAYSTTVRADGTFDLTELPPSEYLVYATTEEETNYDGQGEPPEDLENRAARVRLTSGGTQSIRLKLPEDKSK